MTDSDASVLGGPTAMEIAEFARYLGMDPALDANLLWIAEEALCSPLPENWEEAVRKDGTPYYFNKKENKSTNKHPLEDFYRSLYNEMKEIQSAQQAQVQQGPGGAAGPALPALDGSAAGTEALALASGQRDPAVRRFVTPNEVRDMATYLGIDTIQEFNLLHIAHAAVLAPLPSNWLEFEDEDGNPYYYDRNTLRVTYRHPADEKYFKQVADERARQSSSGMSGLERRLLLMKDSKRKKVEEQGDEALYWMQFVDVHGTDYWYNFKNDRMTYYKPDVLSEMDEAAIMIQSVWRGKQWRQVASAMRGNKQWAFENAAATDIQRRFRGFKTRRLLERDREIAKLASAAVRLQSTFRGYRCRVRWPGLKMELQKEQREKAAIVIQAAMRRKLARNRRELLLEERVRHNAAVIIQSTWRGSAPRKEKRRLILKKRENIAAVDIQRVYRGHLGKQQRLLKEEQKYLHATATKLQCSWRGRLGRIQGKQIIASKKIQARWRGKSERNRFQKQLRAREEHRAAEKIQAGWHGKKGRRRHHHRRRQVSAAKVQRHFRGHVCRKEKRELRKHRAATTIAAHHRGRCGRRYVHQTRSSISLQSAWRGYSARRMVAARVEAADYLAKVMRGYMARQLVKLMVRRKVMNMQATKMQALARGRKKRKMFKDMKHQQSSASSIQQAFRSKKNRKAAKAARKKELEDRATAASKIEGAARRRLQRKRAAQAQDLQEQEQAARLIQSRHRKRLEEAQVAHTSATKIQSAFRGKQDRRKILDKQFGGHASKIQSRFRGRMARSNMERAKLEKSAVKIQAIQRGKFERLRQQKLYSANAATNIQKIYRGKRARKEQLEAQERWARHGFAVKIQAVARGWLCRTDGTRKRSDSQANMSAVLIQSRFRGSQQRRRTESEQTSEAIHQKKALRRQAEAAERLRADKYGTSAQGEGEGEDEGEDEHEDEDGEAAPAPEDDSDMDDGEFSDNGNYDSADTDTDADDADVENDSDDEAAFRGGIPMSRADALKAQMRDQYIDERFGLENHCAVVIQRHWRGWIGRQYVAGRWNDLKYSVEAQAIQSIVGAYSGFLEAMREEPREHIGKAGRGPSRKGRRSPPRGMFPPVKDGTVSPPRDEGAASLWPEMYVKPVWLTISALGGKDINKLVETQMLGRLYKILGEHLLDHADLLGQGRHETHVEFVEEYFVGCEVQYGLQNPEVQAAAEQLAMTSNIFAIKALVAGKYQLALKLFKKAELLTDPQKYRYRRRGDIRAWTFDNIAYYYYRRSKFSAALQYVQKAAKVQHATARLTNASSEPAQQRNYGVIMSHMATIYSKLGRHDYSIDYARRALELVSGGSVAQQDVGVAVCYHNIAVEHVYRFNYKDAVGVEVRAAKMAGALDEVHPWRKQMDTTKRTAHALLDRQRTKSKDTDSSRRASSAGRQGGHQHGGRPSTTPDDRLASFGANDQDRRARGWALDDAARPSTSASTSRRGNRRAGEQRRAVSAGKVGGSRPSSSHGSIRPTSRQQKRIPVTNARLPSPNGGVAAWAEGDWKEGRPPQELAYTIFVYTGNERGAATDANVFIEMYGQGGAASGPRQLHASWKDCFGQGSIDEFALSCVDLGELTRVRIGHDDPSPNSGWLLERIAVSDSTGRHWDFACGRWLDSRGGDGETEVTLRAERVSVPDGAGGDGSTSPPVQAVLPPRAASSRGSGDVSARRRERERQLVNSPIDKEVRYTVSVCTGDQPAAGTSSRVYIVLYGDLEVSEQHRLHNKGKKSFVRGQTDSFNLMGHDVGSITNIRIGHDNSGGQQPGWYLEWVTITNEDTGDLWQFNCSQWLDSERGDGRTVRDFQVSQQQRGQLSVVG
jgi:hypothetical protein